MKPFVYRVKNTDVFVMGDEHKLTSDQSKATIWRSKVNAVTKEVEWMKKKSLVGIMVSKEDTKALDMLYQAGYKGSEAYRVWCFDINVDDLEMVEVEDKPITKPAFEGPYVIRLKGTPFYLRPSTDNKNSITSDKGEAKVFNNPKTDIIGKMERGMATYGTGKSGTVPTKEIQIMGRSTRGAAIFDLILNDEAVSEWAKTINSKLSKDDTLYSEVQRRSTDDTWRYVWFEIPVEGFEREEA